MGEQKKWWINRPWREIQTNLREIDMLDINAEQFVADLQEFKANVVMINAAGIIASYPTSLPFHFQSPYLTGDSLKDIIAACHKADIKVFARTDFSKVRRPIYETHPEWAYVSQKGEIIDYNGDVHVCLNGEYQQHYAPQIIKEAITTHDFDGIFFNMGGYQVKDYSYRYYGICHCDSCKRGFAEMFDAPLPKVEDASDPLFQKYMIFKQQTLKNYAVTMHQVILGVRPDICIANNFELKEGMIRQESNTALDRPLPHWQYSASENTKWAVSSYPEMVSSNTTVDFPDYYHRHVSVSPFQQKLRLAQNLANGGGLDYYIMGRLDNKEDKSGYEGIKEIFHYHAEHGEEYLNISSHATIALLNGPSANQAEYRGWFRFLTENHYVFDTLVVQNALNLSWDKYKAIIVPDYQPLSNEFTARLDAFTHAGGVVISVCRSGFTNEAYIARHTPPLKSLGIDKISSVREDNRSVYFKLDHKDQFTRFPVSDLIYLDSHYVFAEYNDQTEAFFKLIPPHMFGPPERCYYTQVTEHPGFTVSAYGKGCGIFIPWKPGELFHRQGYTNTIEFVADLLEHVAGLKPIQGNLPPMVEATLFEQKGRNSTLLHLVNGTGHFGATFYEPVTLSDLEVIFPAAEAPQSVISLISGSDCEHEYSDGQLTIKLSKLGLFEAIKISF
ncbi:beta-galactosidase trimerization domain-containing protein [Paenibacillus sp. WQ 127069]|uniref:Beta-galactosidase trimerization domain-containing protein n=1 Tax=Paenibacillus baimaensis TaxID=2982185 RepID=A0ABT2USB1_9BACL|nr:alpha-amylase family protein [Paenibacillus sp. WQ 127069]MCU6796554.1 beta-galactosidase trimerization domain-containing protein [Paenibacillus sp. WQ 127069]